MNKTEKYDRQKAEKHKPSNAKATKGKQEKYNHRVIEKKWQEVWDKRNLYFPKLTEIPKDKLFYNLWMFPYPSAEGLHAGHAFASTGSDVYGRYQRMNGKTVFQPIGYDSFGIHSENYALKISENPHSVVKRTTKHYEEQMRALGHGYDWTRTVTTSDINYYRWTEWLFTTLFKAGLAYKKKAQVNWCPSCKTVLADEQVMSPKQAGKEPRDVKGNVLKVTEEMKVCERCGTVAQKKELSQWFFRITDYADRLLEGLSKIDWSERVKVAQKEWIGKSKGLTIELKLNQSTTHNLQPTTKIPVWTKFWETVYGITFLVVSPEYASEKLLPFVPEEYRNNVANYIKTSLKKSKEERGNIIDKSGVPMGIEVINPVNQERVPVFVADYVLPDVGTGAVMGVPAHDERDFAFAKKYKLPIRKVVDVQVETHSIVIKESVKPEFIEEIKKKGWYFTDYEDWGWGIVFPKGGESEYVKLVQSSLIEGSWYVHTDGVLKEVIFRDRQFSIEKENEQAKVHARSIGIREEQLNWDARDKYMFAHEKGGLLVNSGEFNGLDAWTFGKEKMAEWMINEGFAYWQTNYHLRDWLISRQRYWGCPIPMINCEKCAGEGKSWFNSKGIEGIKSTKSIISDLAHDTPDTLDTRDTLIHPDQSDWDSAGWYPEENLPVELPDIKDWKPEGTGKGPLANHPDYYKVKCPACGSDAERETDVADTFLDSSWYFLRYPSVGSETKDKLPFDPEISERCLPVNLYFGGAEHSVLHLMYARFVNMVMHDLGLLEHEEPFPKFFAHGLMIKDGAKMSKSRGNVVNPDEYIEKFGADTLRLYLMFMGPMDGYPDFRDTGIEGMRRFVDKLWRLFKSTEVNKQSSDSVSSEMLAITHKTIKRMTQEIQEFKYNTAIAALMEYVNFLTDHQSLITNHTLQTLCLLIAPFAPHLAEEVYQRYFAGISNFQLPISNELKIEKSSNRKLNGKWKVENGKFESVHIQSWPSYDEKYLISDTAQIVVQVNGKLRATLIVDAERKEDKEFVIGEAGKIENVSKYLEGHQTIKHIFIPGRLINFVI